MGLFTSIQYSMQKYFNDDPGFTEWDCIQCLISASCFVSSHDTVVFTASGEARNLLTGPFATSASLWKVQMVPGKEAVKRTNTSVHSHLCSF